MCDHNFSGFCCSRESIERMVRKEPLESIALRALLVGLLCRGYLKESKHEGRVEQSRLGMIALGAPERSGSRRRVNCS